MGLLPLPIWSADLRHGSAASNPTSRECTALGTAGGGLSPWVPATRVGDPGRVPGLWLQPGSASATEDTWGVNEQVEEFCINLSLFSSFFLPSFLSPPSHSHLLLVFQMNKTEKTKHLKASQQVLCHGVQWDSCTSDSRPTSCPFRLFGGRADSPGFPACFCAPPTA